MIIRIRRDDLIAYLSKPQDALCNHESAITYLCKHPCVKKNVADIIVYVGQCDSENETKVIAFQTLWLSILSVYVPLTG